MKLLLIYNPYSGKGKIKKYEYIKNRLSAKFELTEFITKNIGDISNYIVNNDLHAYEVITICGGDGTINEAIHAISKKDINPKIAVIPLGTMNDFAKSLKMSTNVKKTVKYILNMKTKKHNIYCANDSIFNYGFAIGMLSNISYKKIGYKKVFGRFSYYLSAIKEIFKAKKMNLKVTINGKEINMKANLFIATSTNRIAGYHVKKNNGLTVVIFKGIRLFFPVKLFFYFIFGLAKHKYVTENLDIHTDLKEFNTDGEKNIFNDRIVIYKSKEYEFITK